MKKFTLTVFCILAGCIFFLSGIWVYFQKSMDKVDLGEGEYAASYQKHYLMISNDKDTLMWQSIYQSASETAKEADSDAANAGIRREPELGEHEEIVPPTKAPEKEFDFDDNDPGDDAARDRRQIDRSMARNARNASLDPDDGIDL